MFQNPNSVIPTRFRGDYNPRRDAARTAPAVSRKAIPRKSAAETSILRYLTYDTTPKTILKREASLYVLARGPPAQRKTIRYTRTVRPAALTIHHNHDKLTHVHDKNATIRKTTVGS